jgi:hypothetical protein
MLLLYRAILDDHPQLIAVRSILSRWLLEATERDGVCARETKKDLDNLVAIARVLEFTMQRLEQRMHDDRRQLGRSTTAGVHGIEMGETQFGQALECSFSHLAVVSVAID